MAAHTTIHPVHDPEKLHHSDSLRVDDHGGKDLADSAVNSDSVEYDYPNKGSALEKKLMRKIDWRLIPTLSFMYGCSLIDRTNLPNARLTGMDLSLLSHSSGTGIGDRYSIITLVFFIPYILTEIPGNVALKRGVHPKLWLPTATLLFGVIMITFAYAPNWWTLAIQRALLGIFEGVLFPGCIFLISSWYPRYETQKRISAFYLGGQALGGFGNIIAYGFSTIAPAGGLGGWQWIFILMGVLTCVSALIGYVLVPNFPLKATFLSEEEHKLVHDRITVDRHDYREEEMSWAVCLRHLGNWRIWAMGFMFLGSTLPAYAFAYFLALILRGFGFSVRDSQLLSAPPYIAAIILGMIVGVVADKVRMRGPFVIAGALLSMTGSLIVGYAEANGVRLLGAFFAVMGCQSNIPTVMSWSVNNVRGYGARAINSAVVVASGGIGGIIASVAFRTQDAATGYRPGLWTTVAFQLAIVLVASFTMWHFKRDNIKAREGRIVLQGHPGFLYTL